MATGKTYRFAMKDLVKKTILESGVFRLAGSLRRPSAAILMYHSVLPDPASQFDTLGGIAHSELVFRKQMELLARDFHPISLDQVLDCVSGRGSALPKRSVVITFDDGYRDNSEFAMPVLNRTGVPAIFYVTVDCIENKKLPWPARLRFAFRNTKRPHWIDAFAKKWSLNTPPEREAAFLNSCDACCQLSGAVQESFVRDIEQSLETSIDSSVPESGGADQPNSPMMNYEDLRRIHSSGHIIGSHTMTHPNMAKVNPDDAHREFIESKLKLERNLEAPVKHFSYPCPALSPHWNQKTLEQSRAAGYETAVTTDSGLTLRSDNPLCLKRIRPTKTVEGLRWNLESAFAGRAV